MPFNFIDANPLADQFVKAEQTRQQAEVQDMTYAANAERLRQMKEEHPLRMDTLRTGLESAKADASLATSTADDRARLIKEQTMAAEFGNRRDHIDQGMKFAESGMLGEAAAAFRAGGINLSPADEEKLRDRSFVSRLGQFDSFVKGVSGNDPDAYARNWGVVQTNLTAGKNPLDGLKPGRSYFDYGGYGGGYGGRGGGPSANMRDAQMLAHAIAVKDGRNQVTDQDVFNAYETVRLSARNPYERQKMVLDLAKTMSDSADGVGKAMPDLINDAEGIVDRLSGAPVAPAPTTAPVAVPPSVPVAFPAAPAPAAGGGATPIATQSAPQSYPTAPLDPKQRAPGQIYSAPNGRLGRWTGQGWEQMN